jgi:hypothetical protein
MSVKPEHIPVKTGISINPYLFPYKNRDDHSPSIKNQSAIKKHIEYSFARDFSSVLLRMDSTLNADEMCECDFRFDKWNGNHLHYRSLVDIHTEFINSVSEWTSEDADIKFMPVWYKNDCIRRSHGKGEAYLEEIFRRIPGDVNYLWTGGSEHPIVIDNIEEERIVKITGKEPVLFIKDINPFSCEDESGLHKRYAPGKLRMSSIFEHFELYLADEFYNSERRASVITEDSPADFWDIIKLSTLANYLWNAEEFNPDLSLLKVLTSYFGKEKAFALIEFNELYQGIYEMCIKINIQGKKKRFIRSAEEFFVQMNNLLDDLDNLFEDPVIQKELILRKEKVEELYNRTIQG